MGDAELSDAPRPPMFSADADNTGALTARGRRTRERLMKSAREVLEESGYHASTVRDITERSGLALGTFYRYFDDKEQLYMLLLRSLVDELYFSVTGTWQPGTPLASLYASTLAYLKAYYANRHLIWALRDMAGVVPECAALWWELRLRTYERMERHLESSTAAPSLDTRLVVSALGGMVEQFAHYWYVEGERYDTEPPDPEQAAQTISRLWYRAVYADEAGHDPTLERLHPS